MLQSTVIFASVGQSQKHFGRRKIIHRSRQSQSNLSRPARKLFGGYLIVLRSPQSQEIAIGGHFASIGGHFCFDRAIAKTLRLEENNSSVTPVSKIFFRARRKKSSVCSYSCCGYHSHKKPQSHFASVGVNFASFARQSQINFVRRASVLRSLQSQKNPVASSAKTLRSAVSRASVTTVAK